MDTGPDPASGPLLAEAFVRLADFLVDDFDVVEMLDELTSYCTEFLPVDAAGLLLTDPQNRLRAVLASDEQTHLVELFTAQTLDGPSLDCYRHGHEVLVPDLDEHSTRQRWPRFTEHAHAHGFHAAHALPMRLREKTIGALTLFQTTPTALSRSALRVGQALADVATIAISQQRIIADHRRRTDQLQHALNSRIVIEQAKARLAERHDIPVDHAFELMRSYARNNNLRISELAQTISANTDTHALVIPGASAQQSPRDNPRRGPHLDSPADDRGGSSTRGRKTPPR